MPDFTLNTFRYLLQSLLNARYTFQPFCEFLENPRERAVILRHDVDACPGNSLRTAQIEHELNIRGTYYFRIVPKSNQPTEIREIAAQGHEIGYHYEDLTLCKGNTDEAINSFEKNLNYFRQFGPVKTICMHGSPLSRYDNRNMWKKYDYRNYGIAGEPYFDIDFSQVLYLTDTGRRWDGEKVSVRDKIMQGKRKRGRGGDRERGSRNAFHSSNDIIFAAIHGSLPNQIMLTIHPQRWTNHPLLWTRELVMQNLKNVVKRIVNANSEGRYYKSILMLTADSR
jgi:hypothetical protein